MLITLPVKAIKVHICICFTKKAVKCICIESSCVVFKFKYLG